MIDDIIYYMSRQNDTSEEREVNEWLDEHGQPDFNYLESLKKEGSIESIDKLKAIATDLDVDFNSTTPVDQLIELIRLAVSENDDDNQNVES